VETGLTSFGAALPSTEPNNNSVEVALSLEVLWKRRIHPELLKKDVLSRPQFWLENPTWICCGAFQLNQFRACKNTIILCRRDQTEEQC
jgi:hypothetical protein